MTKITDKDAGKRRQKYNFLDKKGTTKTRQDYIETDYVNGVKNENGELVIRALSADEKEWLSQFISETEHGNVNKTKQIKELVQERKAIRSDRFAAKRKGNVEEMARLEVIIEAKTAEIEGLRTSCNNFYTKESDIKEITDRDNERRRDVYNTAKISDNLVLYDITEYYKFDTDTIKDVNPENLMLEHLNQKKKK